MCVRVTKVTEDRVMDAAALQEKPIGKPYDSTLVAYPSSYEPLCERVVDFMNSYNEN